jgi:WXG100 family type VII secretion target
MAFHPAIQTTEPGMQRAGQALSDTASDFNGYLATINGDMATLQASWGGDASSTFNHAMDAWEASFKKVINELLHMLDVMGVNTKMYSQAEEESSNIAQNFATALPGV